MLRTVPATRYVTPFREGGSLPALVEAEDLGLYVLKFRGAGQGPLALVAEIIACEIGRWSEAMGAVPQGASDQRNNSTRSGETPDDKRGKSEWMTSVLKLSCRNSE
jgi:hypothetical protein